MMTLVIMAAGMGSRYGRLKQIDPVGRHGEFVSFIEQMIGEGVYPETLWNEKGE